MTSAPRRLIILGSTGSIGVSTLDVVAHLAGEDGPRFEVVGLAAGGNAELLREQAERFGVTDVALADPTREEALAGLPRVHAGPDSARALVAAVARAGDLVLGAMVGVAGLPATLEAITRGCDVALANKETLVAAGALVLPLARRHGVTLLPVDSEHNAIAQCLRAGREAGEVRRIVLTASGGPFRTWSVERTRDASVADALNHPTWSMGPKISVDSASMMNKALEVVEAHWLFGLPPEQIEVVIHPQSIVHGFVEFVDGSVIAQMGAPDMRTPIQSALTWPERTDGSAARLDLTALGGLEFEPLDDERFPAVALARACVRAGGTAGAVFNAANEAAVEAFLAGGIPFGRIPELVAAAVRAIPAGPVDGLDDVLRADDAARSFVGAQLGSPALK